MHGTLFSNSIIIVYKKIVIFILISYDYFIREIIIYIIQYDFRYEYCESTF